MTRARRGRGGARRAGHSLVGYVGLCVVVACIAGSSCRADDGRAGGYKSAIDLTPATPVVGHVTTATVSLGVGPDRRPWPGAKLQVEAHMSHPGMAPVIAPVTEESAGVYRARLTFTMAGDWILFVSGELPDGRRIRERRDGVIIAHPPA